MNPIFFSPKVAEEEAGKLALPRRQFSASAGIDLFSQYDVTIGAWERKTIPTGWEVQIPAGYYGRIADVSSLAYQFGLHVLGGVIDSGYTGEVVVLLLNLTNDAVKIPSRCKIAQLIVTPCYVGPVTCITANLREQMYTQTDRKDQGLGLASTTQLWQPGTKSAFKPPDEA